jgi:hypothetical protein
LKEQKENGVNNPKKCYKCELVQLKIEGYEQGFSFFLFFGFNFQFLSFPKHLPKKKKKTLCSIRINEK